MTSAKILFKIQVSVRHVFEGPPFTPLLVPWGSYLCLQSHLSLLAFSTCFGFGGDQKYLLSYTAAQYPSLELVLATECYETSKNNCFSGLGLMEKAEEKLCNFRAVQMIEACTDLLHLISFSLLAKKWFFILSEQWPLWALGLLMPMDSSPCDVVLIDSYQSVHLRARWSCVESLLSATYCACKLHLIKVEISVSLDRWASWVSRKLQNKKLPKGNMARVRTGIPPTDSVVQGFSIGVRPFSCNVMSSLDSLTICSGYFFIPMVSSARLLIGVLSTGQAPTGFPVCSVTASWSAGRTTVQAPVTALRELTCQPASLCTFLWLIQSDSDYSFTLWPPSAFTC